MVQRAAAACARGVYLARAASVGGSPRDQLAVAWGPLFLFASRCGCCAQV